jgi:predicted DNA binding protein
MGYFRELPNLEYESPFATRISSSSYVLAKNIFRRMKIRDDLQNIFTLFNKYEIKEGARPDTIAEEIYGKSDLDWVVLLSANIINVRDQWPLSSKDLYEYTVSKYGLENINNVHHYETKEVKDSDGNLILPKGQIVDENYSIRFKNGGTYIEKSNITSTISNYVYEVRENEKKQTIYILKPFYLQQFLNDMRSEMVYSDSSQFVNKSLIRTQNTRIS